MVIYQWIVYDEETARFEIIENDDYYYARDTAWGWYIDYLNKFHVNDGSQYCKALNDFEGRDIHVLTFTDHARVSFLRNEVYFD